MKLAIIRTLRRIADAMEGRADFPPVRRLTHCEGCGATDPRGPNRTGCVGIFHSQRAGIEPDTPWPRPKWCAWEGSPCGQPVDCVLYGCGAERAANADVVEAKRGGQYPPHPFPTHPPSRVATTKVAGVTIKHPPSMADEVEKMRAEQNRDIANVEMPARVIRVPAAVIRKFQPTNPRAKPARLTPIRKPRG